MNKQELKRLIDDRHRAGKKVALSFCSHVPEEVLEAAGLCHFRLPYMEGMEDSASRILINNVCPLVKNVCDICEDPALSEADLILAETSCDGKKKMYELLTNQDRLYFYQVGQGADRDYVRPLIKSEVRYLIRELEKRFGIAVTDADLREAAKRVNEERESVLELMAVQRAFPPAAYGMEIYQALEESRTLPELKDRTSANRRAREAFLARKSPVSPDARRILLTGCPMSGVYEKIIHGVEANGGVVVAIENCEVMKTAVRHFDTEQENLMEAFADCYQNTACAIMSPNLRRFALLRQLAAEYEAEGVLEVTLQTCHPYTVERDRIQQLCKNELQIPYMAVETDMTDSDTGQLTTRIAAFIEML